jgi:hypothetical protein
LVGVHQAYKAPLPRKDGNFLLKLEGPDNVYFHYRDDRSATIKKPEVSAEAKASSLNLILVKIPLKRYTIVRGEPITFEEGQESFLNELKDRISKTSKAVLKQTSQEKMDALISQISSTLDNCASEIPELEEVVSQEKKEISGREPD